MPWVLDLDGVVWLGEDPIPGAAEAVAALRAAGERVLFATNNSSARVADQEAKLAAMGIPAEGDVVSSAQATARLVEPGQRVLVAGGPGLREALEARGAVVLDATAHEPDHDVDAVAVGFHRAFDYEGLRRAATAVWQGARFLASNDDATYPTPAGMIPGGGAIAASIAYAVGGQPLIAGKPHQPMADLIHDLVGDTAGDPGTMVGDRPSTDGAFAKTLGYRFALVLSGVTHPDDLPVSPTPDLIAPDLATLVRDTVT
jgi:HAD superfamily hydrolase (TIGR01450 family)